MIVSTNWSHGDHYFDFYIILIFYIENCRRIDELVVIIGNSNMKICSIDQTYKHLNAFLQYSSTTWNFLIFYIENCRRIVIDELVVIIANRNMKICFNRSDV